MITMSWFGNTQNCPNAPQVLVYAHPFTAHYLYAVSKNTRVSACHILAFWNGQK